MAARLPAARLRAGELDSPACVDVGVLQGEGAACEVGRLELKADDGSLVTVDLARSEQDTLRLEVGERLHVTPRRVQVFFQ